MFQFLLFNHTTRSFFYAMRIEFDKIFDKIRSLISAKRTEMYENFVIFDMRCLTIFREFAWIPLFISVFWRKTCLHNKSCNKIMAFRPHQLSMAKAIEKKKVTSSSNFSERDIFTPLRTSNPAFISNHYSAKNLGMSSKYTWYKYERRFFLCQMKTLPICANSETFESPQFLYWRGEKMSFIMWKFENHEINDFT